jgi:predicted alpha/beta hydrolase family esterase
MIERVLHDVWIYLERRSVRREIDAIVAPVFGTETPVVCLAHSLGTVVAYCIIKECKAGKVSNLITVGSPLGLKNYREALAPIKHPQVVERWFNARDKRNVVSSIRSTASISRSIRQSFTSIMYETGHPMRTGISGYVTNAETADEIYRSLAALGSGPI